MRLRIVNLFTPWAWILEVLAWWYGSRDYPPFLLNAILSSGLLTSLGNPYKDIMLAGGVKIRIVVSP